MGLISWLKSILGTETVPLNTSGDLIAEYIELYGDIYVRELAFWSAVNIVANAVSKCEIKTYLNGKEVKGKEYYLWNIEPNKNQNSSVFMHKLIAKLYRDNECLVIDRNGQLYVADSYEKKLSTIYGDSFYQVKVDDLVFKRAFTQEEVLYFKLSEGNVRKIVIGLFESYSKLITYSMTAYQRSRGTKGIFKYDTLPVAGTEARKIFDDLINGKISKWLAGDNAALPLGNGQDWKELEHKTYTSESTRDIRAMIDDVSDFTAKGFGIPPALMRGDVQDTSKAVEQLLTFCVDPLVDMIQEEIIRKRIGYDGFKAGTKIKIDTKSIKHIDLLSVAASIDKLIGSGAFCVNSILEAVGDDPIDEPWARQHWITKNYETIEQALIALGGGENI